VQRQSAPPDPELMFGQARPAPPVVPRRRVVIDDLPDEPVPAEPPIVSRVTMVAEEVAAPPAVARDGTLWAPPVPTFTYLAGAAGSGKTFATRAWEEPGLLLCATTGIAAINVGGETINSILGYFDTPAMTESYLRGSLTERLARLWQAGVRRLVLDEVSMLDAEQLTCLVKAIDELSGKGYSLTRKEYDGPPPDMGLTLVGDFLQLPPVKAKFAFTSPEWPRFAEATITLTEIRRQDDPEFIEMLRHARVGRGKKVAEYFAAHGGIAVETDEHFAGSTILATNEHVDRYNGQRMAALTGKTVSFTSGRWGELRREWKQQIPEVLTLKIGALVMILSNYRDPEGHELVYVNGDLGEVVDATDRSCWVQLQRTGEIVEVVPVTREVKQPIDGARKKALHEQKREDRLDGEYEITGGITYLPLRVAYASTCHKSQGLSLDAVQVNFRDPFFGKTGMLYVALSRARTAAGLRLVGSPKVLVERCVCDPQLKEWL
jgi:ATP-dependent DNA helicase PIF1